MQQQVQYFIAMSSLRIYSVAYDLQPSSCHCCPAQLSLSITPTPHKALPHFEVHYIQVSKTLKRPQKTHPCKNANYNGQTECKYPWHMWCPTRRHWPGNRDQHKGGNCAAYLQREPLLLLCQNQRVVSADRC